MADKLEPKTVLGIVAHPDDLDFGAGGTMAKFAAGGASVHYLILTDGSKGTSDPNLSPSELIKIRRSEQQTALSIIGGASVEFLDCCDGEMEVTLELKRDIVKRIRKIKPDVVVTMDPTMVYSAEHGIINHPDHRAAGQATLDAVFPLARDHLAFPELLDAGYQPHKTKTVLLINFERANYHLDISEFFDLKTAALAAHKSQMPDMPRVESLMRDMAERAGQDSGFSLAEAFMRIDIR